MKLSPLPVLHIDTDPETFPAAAMVMGALPVYPGYLLFKLDIKGIFIASFLLLVDMVNFVLHRDRWDHFVKGEMVNRRNQVKNVVQR